MTKERKSHLVYSMADYRGYNVSLIITEPIMHRDTLLDKYDWYILQLHSELTC